MLDLRTSLMSLKELELVIYPPNSDLAIPYSIIAGTTVKRKSKFNSIQQ